MIRKLSAGIYNYLPLGLRSIRKFENIVREDDRVELPRERLDPRRVEELPAPRLDAEARALAEAEAAHRCIGGAIQLCQITDIHRRAALGLQDDLPDVVLGPDQPHAPDDVLLGLERDDAAADVRVVALQRLEHVPERQLELL